VAAPPPAKNRWLVPALVVLLLAIGGGAVWQFVLNKPAETAGTTGGAPVSVRNVGTVAFNVTPATARVQVGSTVLQGGQGRLPPGTYDYVVSATGYVTDRGSITVTAGQRSDKIVTLRAEPTQSAQRPQQRPGTTPTQPQPSAPAPVSAPAATGSVLISVSPTDAEVTLSGRGRISARGLQTLAAGSYTLSATAPNCQPGSTSFTVAAGDAAKPVVLRLTCTSQ
jgi:hypothetical protein